MVSLYDGGQPTHCVENVVAPQDLEAELLICGHRGALRTGSSVSLEWSNRKEVVQERRTSRCGIASVRRAALD